VGAGCGGSDKSNDPEDKVYQSIEIVPASAALQIMGGNAATQAFEVIGHTESGETETIKEGYSFSVLPEGLGSVEGTTFKSTTAYGGKGEVRVNVGELVASAQLNISIKNITLIPDANNPLPNNTPDLFGGGVDDTRKPSIVYPNDGVLLPTNLGGIEVHWLRGVAKNTVFEVSFANGLTDIRAYVRCNKPAGVVEDGCTWKPDLALWNTFAQTNRGLEPVTIRIRATDDQGTSVGNSATQTLEFAQDDIAGTLYYWSPSIASLVRHDFGDASDTFERVVPAEVDLKDPKKPADNGGKCLGCHAVSRDGVRIAASGRRSAGNYLLYDLKEAAPIVNETENTDDLTSFFSFNPDGTQLVAVRPSSYDRTQEGLVFYKTNCPPNMSTPCSAPTPLALRDANGVEVIATHPEWSPDGTRIVFTHVTKDTQGAAHAPLHGSISYIQKQGTGWSAVMPWVARAEKINRYNPSFAPDGSFILFNETHCPGNDVVVNACDGYTDPQAKLFAVETGGTPIILARANARGALDTTDALTNTFPRFSPFESAYKRGSATADNKVYWMTFSTSRRYGLLTTPDALNPAQTGGRGQYLWMVAIRPSALKDKKDPSFKAFLLPFQDLKTSNHIGVWTTVKVVREVS